MQLDYITKKNNEKIKQLVTENFSLESRCLERFMNLIDNPWEKKVPEYDEVYRQPDLRIRFPLTTEFLQELDQQWQVFVNAFSVFCEELNVSYQDFSNGTVIFGKNKVKIRKALDYFYLDPKNIAFTRRNFNNISIRKRKNNRHNKTELFAYLNLDFPSYDNDENDNVVWEKEITSEDIINKYANINNIVISSSLRTYLMENIGEKLYEINNRKIPFSVNKNYQVVISANFADWFLSSTAESWGNCCNFESNYSQAYWFGQPGVIGDKNKVLIYITDGREKEYLGIKVDRLIARSWVHTVKIRNGNYAYFVNNGYPNLYHKLYIKILERISKQRNMSIFHGEYRNIPGEEIYKTKYPIPFFWHIVLNKDNSDYPSDMLIDCSTFHDNGYKSLIDKDYFFVTNDNYYMNAAGSGFYCYKDHKNKVHSIESGRFNYQRGLNYLRRERYTARNLFRLSREGY